MAINGTVSSFENCTAVTEQCPVEATTYGYTPSLVSNICLLGIFSILTVIQLMMAIAYRSTVFGTLVTVGFLLESIGYLGRVIMHHNPWDDSGFMIQCICLIVAPTFFSAGIYHSLESIVHTIGAEHSRIRPRMYTWIFTLADLSSVVLQTTGGGLAGGNKAATGAQTTGNTVMVAGLAVQLVTMMFCYWAAIDFGWSVVKASSAARRISRTRSMISDGVSAKEPYELRPALRFFLISNQVAFTVIFIRCIYTLVELSGGQGGEIMRHEADFMMFDGAMMTIAGIHMTVAHPGMLSKDDMRNRIGGDDHHDTPHTRTRMGDDPYAPEKPMLKRYDTRGSSGTIDSIDSKTKLTFTVKPSTGPKGGVSVSIRDTSSTGSASRGRDHLPAPGRYERL